MKLTRRSLIRHLATASVVIAGANVADLAIAQQTMTVILSGKYMLSGSSAVIEVMDRNWNDRIIGRWTLMGNQEISIAVHRNNAGYANIATRIVSNSGDWHGSSQLHEGEAVYP
jgi:hypothetical protein